jgi:hypothetical protein
VVLSTVYYTSTICVSSTIFHENQTGSVAFFLACSQVQSIMLLFLLMIMHNGTWKTTQGPSSIMWLPYMPLKSIPPSIRTSGTLYHVMCAVFSAQWSCVMGWEQSGSRVTTGFNLYNSWERNGPVYKKKISVGSSKWTELRNAYLGDPMPIECTNSCFVHAISFFFFFWILS